MAGQDALLGLPVRLERPLPPFAGSAQQDAVGARHHVEPLVERDVADLGLRQHDGQLALERNEFLVADQGARADAGAVHDPALGEVRHLVQRPEVADPDPAAGELEVPHHRAEVHRRLDHHGRVLAGVAHREGMGPGLEIARLRKEVGEPVGLARASEGDVAQRVVREPVHAVADAHHLLEDPVRDPRRPFQPVLERVGVHAGVGHRVGAPLGAGHVRGGVRREVLRVDGDGHAATLEQAGGGEADGAAADHRRPRRRRAVADEFLDGQPGAAPGQRHPGAAVAVVVDEDPAAAQILALDPEPGRTEGAEPDHRADDPVPRDVDRRKPERGLRKRIGRRAGGRNRPAGAGRRSAGGEAGSELHADAENAAAGRHGRRPGGLRNGER